MFSGIFESMADGNGLGVSVLNNSISLTYSNCSFNASFTITSTASFGLSGTALASSSFSLYNSIFNLSGSVTNIYAGDN